MQHETYVKESSIGVLPKIIAIVAIVVLLAGVGAYVVYSKMWNPTPVASSY